ncbi:ATP-binding cassette domain-containing protein [Flammeovirga kamogawensis]|uniref:ATP-binding cassette domain-containing protein n=1 Tax=Flammeovirga kamogawensis TaxID=373891 RepID=A0ABX8GTP3_9BACT|nr:ATP-binding cassette domain-containing protein [Flammeovirga kamogawensis]MBB6462522.1 ABC-2 type transport system ATP-binding protein [Flammeovirga kamogawensis]QWG06741.1 ATP-binding cassette domain-containing protein [Flammeovirga kamogawensis]TRX68564.1 ATP-binding cassette domain-containing protein [Flammeovirga kamogawensis]
MLKLNDISISFGEKQVLKKVSFEIQSGEILGVLGNNGVGKTTLFEIIAQWKRNFSGELFLEEEKLQRKDVVYLEAKPQFYSRITGKEHLDLFKVKYPNFDYEEWNKVFQLPLNDLVDHYSTGMKKRLALMMLLSSDAPIILLDEPFIGLDVEASFDLDKIILSLKEKGKIILIASHTISSLQKLCDSIYHFANGEIANVFHKDAFDTLDNYAEDFFKNDHQKTLDKLL